MSRVALTRTGGLAGMPLSAEVDTAHVDDPDAAWVAAALDRVDLPSLAASSSEGGAGAPGVPDRFRYRLDVDHAGATHRLEFAESALPGDLRPLVDRLVARARRPREA